MITHFFTANRATERNTITLKHPQENVISHLQPGLEMQSNMLSVLCLEQYTANLAARANLIQTVTGVVRKEAIPPR